MLPQRKSPQTIRLKANSKSKETMAKAIVSFFRHSRGRKVPYLSAVPLIYERRYGIMSTNGEPLVLRKACPTQSLLYAKPAISLKQNGGKSLL